MPTLITHVNPHLDDIAAIWLYKKFFAKGGPASGWQDAEVKFISAGKGNLEQVEDENTVYLGVGRGKFDEHKGDLDDCAASLVFKSLVEEGFAPKDEIELGALEELVDYVRKDDLGKLKDLPYPDFAIANFLRVSGEDKVAASTINTKFGEDILDRVYGLLINKHKALKDWESRVEFDSKFGKVAAVNSENVNRNFCDAKDSDVFLMYDPKYKSVQFYTPNDGIDLEALYNKLKELDPEAGWFLHQSHKMVICRSGSAPDSQPTKFSFEELIEVLKNL